MKSYLSPKILIAMFSSSLMLNSYLVKSDAAVVQSENGTKQTISKPAKLPFFTSGIQLIEKDTIDEQFASFPKAKKQQIAIRILNDLNQKFSGVNAALLAKSKDFFPKLIAHNDNRTTEKDFVVYKPIGGKEVDLSGLIAYLNQQDSGIKNEVVISQFKFNTDAIKPDIDESVALVRIIDTAPFGKWNNGDKVIVNGVEIPTEKSYLDYFANRTEEMSEWIAYKIF